MVRLQTQLGRSYPDAAAQGLGAYQQRSVASAGGSILVAVGRWQGISCAQS
jgi:hypothetical protein